MVLLWLWVEEGPLECLSGPGNEQLMKPGPPAVGQTADSLKSFYLQDRFHK